MGSALLSSSHDRMAMTQHVALVILFTLFVGACKPSTPPVEPDVASSSKLADMTSSHVRDSTHSEQDLTVAPQKASMFCQELEHWNTPTRKTLFDPNRFPPPREIGEDALSAYLDKWERVKDGWSCHGSFFQETWCASPGSSERLICACGSVDAQDASRQTSITLDSPEVHNDRIAQNASRHTRFMLWDGPESEPRILSMPDTLAPREPGDEPFFQVAEYDLDADGHKELLLTVRSVHNTGLGLLTHQIVLQGNARDRGLHLYGPLSQPDSFETPQNPLLKPLLCGEQASTCCLATRHVSFKGNGCGGCTAGGPTGSTYRTYLYKSGELGAGPETSSRQSIMANEQAR